MTHLRKLIDIPESIVKDLKILAVMEGKPLKIFIESKLIELVEQSKPKKEAKMFRLMNHDNERDKPIFESYTVKEHNEQFNTNYSSIEEAIETDYEYLFTQKQMQDYLTN